MSDRFAVILAAGKGTRMKSPRAKVLHEVGGRTMLAWSVALAQDLGCKRSVVVVAPDAPDVAAAARKLVGAENVVIQREPLGTGNAVDSAREAFAGLAGQSEGGQAIVLYADTPLVPKGVCEQAFAALNEGASVCVLGFDAALPNRYGRLVADADGELEAIVEANDATPEQLNIPFCNSGVMAAPVKLMFDLLREVTNKNAKREYYLTDLVGLARQRGLKTVAARCNERDVQGVNSQIELAVVERAFQEARRTELMIAGVTMTAPETVFLSWDTKVAPGVAIEPYVIFGVGVSIEEGALVKSFSHFTNAKVGHGAEVGPFTRLRPGAVIGRNAHIGNFVEVKNVAVGEGAKANHLAYLGDGEIGAGSNIGAGTIFCNYDGYFKYRTVLGKDVFIGSNSSLVAPINVADGAYVGAASVITEDVQADALALARGRQSVKSGWAKGFRESQSAAKKAGKKPKGAV